MHPSPQARLSSLRRCFCAAFVLALRRSKCQLVSLGARKLHIASSCCELLHFASHCFQLRQTCTKRFSRSISLHIVELCPHCSKLHPLAWHRVASFCISSSFRLLQIASNCFRLLEVASDCFKLLRIASHCFRLLEQHLPTCSPIVETRPPPLTLHPNS